MNLSIKQLSSGQMTRDYIVTVHKGNPTDKELIDACDAHNLGGKVTWIGVNLAMIKVYFK